VVVETMGLGLFGRVWTTRRAKDFEDRALAGIWADAEVHSWEARPLRVRILHNDSDEHTIVSQEGGES
jgi:hypothetical protein